MFPTHSCSLVAGSLESRSLVQHSLIVVMSEFATRTGPSVHSPVPIGIVARTASIVLPLYRRPYPNLIHVPLSEDHWINMCMLIDFLFLLGSESCLLGLLL